MGHLDSNVPLPPSPTAIASSKEEGQPSADDREDEQTESRGIDAESPIAWREEGHRESSTGDGAEDQDRELIRPVVANRLDDAGEQRAEAEQVERPGQYFMIELDKREDVPTGWRQVVDDAQGQSFGEVERMCDKVFPTVSVHFAPFSGLWMVEADLPPALAAGDQAIEG